MQKPNIEEKKNIVLIGPPGSGKTRTIYDTHPIEQIYSKPGGQWWDGYHGQEIVLIDDIDKDDYKISDMLKWLDRYPVQVPIKGGFVWLKAKTIYITSNKRIQEWWSYISAEHLQAFTRRLSKVEELLPNPPSFDITKLLK